MVRRIHFLGLLAAILAVGSRPFVEAAEPPPKLLSERPFWTLFISSLDRIQSACEIVFESVDRSDLSKTMDDRLKTYRNLSGIARTKPVGVMSTWSDISLSEIVFVPVEDIQELLKTSTFGVVGFHEVKPDHYEIERPGAPYQVVVRKGYAYFADSVSSIRAVQVTPEQLTRGLSDRYEIALHLDLLQIPHPTKLKFIANIRSQVEPWLQPQDDEIEESANLRKSLGQLILDLVERVILDTKNLTIGGKLDSKTRQAHVEIVLQAVPKSQMATSFNRLSSHRSEFAPLIQPDLPAGVAFNLPLSGLIPQILGPSDQPPVKGAQLDAALQLAGTGMGDLSLIAAVHGPDAVDLSNAIPRLLLKLEQSGQFKDVNENFDIHRGVILHSLIPRELPTAITNWVGTDVEMILGQDRKTVWMGLGKSEPLLDRLRNAIDLIDQPSTSRTTSPLVRARFEARKLPELVASDLLVPDANPQVARQAFSQGNDGFNLTINPIADGLKLRIEFEEGFTRLVGQNWIRQLEQSQTP